MASANNSRIAPEEVPADVLAPASGLDIIGSPSREKRLEAEVRAIKGFDDESDHAQFKHGVPNRLLASSICSELINVPRLEGVFVEMILQEKSLVEKKSGRLARLAASGFNTTQDENMVENTYVPAMMKIK